MTDTLYCDISEFNPFVNDEYPYRWLCFRSNDGTYRDPHFAGNLAWCKKRAAEGKLDGFLIYTVYRPDGGRWAATHMQMIGTPHPLQGSMIDAESWNGQIRGDHSADINAGRARLAKWYGTDARVTGYGNASDLLNIWRKRGNVRIVLANYVANAGFPGKFAHQFTDNAHVAPFGKVDLNSADGFTSRALQRMLQLATAAPASLPAPADVTVTEDNKMAVEFQTLTFDPGQQVDATPRYMLWGGKGYVTIATGPCDIVSGSIYIGIDTVNAGPPDAAYQVQTVVDTVDSTGKIVIRSASLGSDEFARTSGRTMRKSPIDPIHLNAGQRLRVKVLATDGLEGKTAVAIFRGCIQKS